MPVIDLPIGWTVVLDSIAWAILQPSIAYLAIRLPDSVLGADQWLYRTRAWERGGSIYEKLFRVKAWKSWLPSGGPVFRGGFSMRRIVSHDTEYLRRWVKETCRAELTHYIALASSVLFFLWNPLWLALVMVLYAVITNVPCIIVQRYNRPYFVRLLSVRDSSADQPVLAGAGPMRAARPH
ncbi:MAG: glycosyl-4,4'-diaponeurosporenoate acyltransferase [Chloroflexi bacterium]|nr:glycosyl-4,4'-diaponeurosporenoate acyltransferase [Chloroflexota bacterium]